MSKDRVEHSDEIPSGRLALALVFDLEQWRHSRTDSAEYLCVDFYGEDWKAIFIDLFRCPALDQYTNSEDIASYTERNRLRFEQHLKGYPMLSRIFDMYEYASYDATEVQLLHDECLKLRTDQPHLLAQVALSKLLTGCYAALFKKAALVLVPD